MRGHVTGYKLELEKVAAKLLPLKPSDAQLRVLISTDYTFDQQKIARRQFAVRRERVKALIEWGQRNNPYFAGVKLDSEALASLPDNDTCPDIVLQYDQPSTASAASGTVINLLNTAPTAHTAPLTASASSASSSTAPSAHTVPATAPASSASNSTSTGALASSDDPLVPEEKDDGIIRYNAKACNIGARTLRSKSALALSTVCTNTTT
jgi:hypothetical protein